MADINKRAYSIAGLLQRSTIRNTANDYVTVTTNLKGNEDLQYVIKIADLGIGTGSFIPITDKGNPLGVATLDGNGKVPLSQLPDSVIDVIDDAVTNLTQTWSSDKIQTELNLKSSVAHAAEHLITGSDVIDADDLDVTYIPTNYTRDSAIPEASSVRSLAAHLKGINDRFQTANGVQHTELRTLTSGEVANGFLTTSDTITENISVGFYPKNGPRQYYGDDFSVTLPTTISWTGLGLDGVLAEGDKITLTYK